MTTPSNAGLRGRDRAIRLVLAALLLGAVLAVVPRPAFAVERGVRVDSETPELVAAAPSDRPGGGNAEGLVDDEPAVGAGPTSPAPGRTRALSADIDDFMMIGATFASRDVDGGRLRIRVDGEWAPWQALTNLDGEHGPDPGTEEAGRARPASDPIWVGAADGYELDLPADAAEVQVHLVRETRERVAIVDGTDEAGAYQMPAVNQRASWGARKPKGTPDVAPALNLAVVHHTVNSNSYSAADVPALLRSIQAYHMDAQGWSDIGYNFVVDRFGRTWEGRSNSLYQAVVGAHSKGSNSGSTGVAFLGDGTTIPLNASAHEAVARLIAWKLPLHGSFFTGPEIVGHRDRFPTSCPGDAIHRQLGSIRTRAVQLRPPPGPFLDVPYTAWNGGHIAWGKFLGIATGYPDGNFAPTERLNRAQLVTMLWGMVGRPPASTPHGFTDVPRSSWLTPALDWVREQGVMTGYPDGSFRGENEVRRDAIAVLLWRWATAPVVTAPHGFTDIAPGVWSDDALAWAKATGVIDGYPNGRFRPARTIERGQILPMLYDLRPFADVPATASYAAGAHWAFHQRISLGYNDRTFRGDQDVSRSQGTSMVWRMMDAPTTPLAPDHGWPDVADGVWFDTALDWATEAGVVSARPDGLFHPDDALLRHETVLWIWRMAGSPPAGSTRSFDDVPEGAPYEAALNWAVEHGIASGYPDNTFRPDETVTRAQWTMMLHRLASTETAWAEGVTPPTTTVF